MDPSVHGDRSVHRLPFAQTPNVLLWQLFGFDVSQDPVLESNTPPLLKQSISFLHCALVRVLALPRQALLQSVNSAAGIGAPEQSTPNPLMMQFKVSAVSCRVFCSLLLP